MNEANSPRVLADTVITASQEVRIRKVLALVALGKVRADRRIRVGRLLDVHSRQWLADQEIVIKGQRIAFVGPVGSYPGEVCEKVEAPDLSAVPGFGEPMPDNRPLGTLGA